MGMTIQIHVAEVVKSNYYEYNGNDNTNTFVEVLSGLPYSCITSAKENKRIITTRPCIWSSIYKREFLIRNGIKFNETPGASYQDTAFSFNVWVLADSVYFVKEPFLHYRIDNENSSVNSTGKIFSICDEFQKIETILNANQELKESYKPMLQVLKLNTYRWNEGRIAEEYKAYFRDQTALELMKAEYEGYLDKNLFDDYQKEYLEKIMYEYKEKQKYDAYIFNEYHVMLNSESWKIGHGLVLTLNKIKNIFHKK